MSLSRSTLRPTTFLALENPCLSATSRKFCDTRLLPISHLSTSRSLTPFSLFHPACPLQTPRCPFRSIFHLLYLTHSAVHCFLSSLSLPSPFSYVSSVSTRVLPSHNALPGWRGVRSVLTYESSWVLSRTNTSKSGRSKKWHAQWSSLCSPHGSTTRRPPTHSRSRCRSLPPAWRRLQGTRPSEALEREVVVVRSQASADRADRWAGAQTRTG